MSFKVFCMRVVAISLATIAWTFRDVCIVVRELGEAIAKAGLALLEVLLNILLGPFVNLRRAWKLRHVINEKTTWRKPKK